MIDINTVVRTTTAILGIYSVFSSIEYLFIRGFFAKDGLMSWDILRLSFNKLPLSIFEPLMNRFILVLLIRLTAGILLIMFSILNYSSLFVIFVIFFTDILILLRFTAGLSGASEMSMMISTGLLIAVGFSGNSAIQTMAILFIAMQGGLSYFIAGVAKLTSESWRSGTALEMIFSTNTWGNSRIFNLIQKYPIVKKYGTWPVIAFELFFPLTFIIGHKPLIIILLLGIMFHMFNGIFMGVNEFLYIFPGTYPSIIYINYTLHHLL